MIKADLRPKGFVPLKNKLVLQYAMVITSITIFLATFFYSYSAGAIQDKNNDFFRTITRQTTSSLNSLFSGAEEGSRYLRFNETVKAILRRGQEPGYGLGDQITDYYALTHLVTDNIWNDNIRSVYLYCNNNAIYTKEEQCLYHVREIEGEDWYDAVVELQGVPMWYATEDGEVFYACALIDLYARDRFLGVLRVNLNTGTLIQVLQSVNETSHGEAALITPGKIMPVCIGRSPELLEEYLCGNMPKPSSEEIISDAQHNRKILVTKLVNEWQLVTTVSEEIFYPDRMALVVTAVILAVGTILLAAAFIHLFVKKLTVRIDNMISFMERVDISSEQTLREEGNDELTILQASFNQMLATVRTSVRATELAIRRKNEADYNILQEQINPHFLYNCLDSINWMALEKGCGDISKMARLLGKFYRLTLSWGRWNVSLQKEVEHSKIYVEIMQIRFDGQINVSYQVDEQALGMQVPKLILQPLLENAIQHGISCRESQEGQIRVRIWRETECLVLEVTDTGAGMSREAVEELNRELAASEGKTGYGMRNVDRRLRYVFGEGSGVRVRSIPGRGTRVRLLCVIGKEETAVS